MKKHFKNPQIRLPKRPFLKVLKTNFVLRNGLASFCVLQLNCIKNASQIYNQGLITNCSFLKLERLAQKQGILFLFEMQMQ